MKFLKVLSSIACLVSVSSAYAGSFKNSYVCSATLFSVNSNGDLNPIGSHATASVEYKTGLDSAIVFTEPTGGTLTARIFTGAQAGFAYRGGLQIDRGDINSGYVTVYKTSELPGNFLNLGTFENYQVTFSCNANKVLL